MIKGPVEIKADAPNPRMFVGACDEFINIKLVKTQPINHKFRMFETETTKEEYNSLSEIKYALDEYIQIPSDHVIKKIKEYSYNKPV